VQYAQSSNISISNKAMDMYDASRLQAEQLKKERYGWPPTLKLGKRWLASEA
jgi:hypothetical protein